MPTCPFCSKTVPDNSSICPHCLRAQPVAVPAAARAGAARSSGGGSRKLLILGLLVLGLGVYAFRERDSIMDSLPRHRNVTPEPAIAAAPAPAPQVAPTIAPPVDIRIGDSSAVTVAANSYLALPFSGEDRSTCKLRGVVRSVSGGPVDVYVVDGLGTDDLANGRPPRKYYETGASTNVLLDANLDGRSHYSLVVANLGARTRAKTVKVQASATCAD